jgi:hypothetical protein
LFIASVEFRRIASTNFLLIAGATWLLRNLLSAMRLESEQASGKK